MGFLRLKCMRSEVLNKLKRLKVAVNPPWMTPKMSFRPLWSPRWPAMTILFCNVGTLQGGSPHFNNAIHLAWPKCAVYEKQLFITIFYLRFIYQNAMTLSSPRMNGVATICFFSGLPSAKLMKFVTARQQMKRTVGATP